MIQDATLFPHLDVLSNVMLGVERDPEAVRRFDELRQLLSIEGLDLDHEIAGDISLS